MSDEMLEIAIYGSRLEAELAKQQLQAAGIAVMVGSDSAGGMIPSLGAAEGHRLLVRAADADRATEVLEAEADQVIPEADPPAGG